MDQHNVPAPKPRWLPAEMVQPPLLDLAIPAGPIEPRYALLINPFYPKDPNASFGKHVLTPSLALTSFAATTPEQWKVQYWDENLLDGRPPFAPMPEVVGITVHLTFALRAFELARWYRSRGSKVVLGGLHVVSCPEECAPHADALAVGDGSRHGAGAVGADFQRLRNGIDRDEAAAAAADRGAVGETRRALLGTQGAHPARLRLRRQDRPPRRGPLDLPKEVAAHPTQANRGLA